VSESAFSVCDDSLRFPHTISACVYHLRCSFGPYDFISVSRTISASACLCAWGFGSFSLLRVDRFQSHYQHCIHRFLQLAIATYNLGLRLGSGLRFRVYQSCLRAVRFGLRFRFRLALRIPFAFDYIPIVACSQYAYGLRLPFGFDLWVSLSTGIALTDGNRSVRFRLAATTSRALLIPSVSSPAGSIFPSWPYVYGHYLLILFRVLRSCCDRCTPFTTAFSTPYSRLSIGVDSFDFIPDFEASTPVIFFRCWPSVSLRTLSSTCDFVRQPYVRYRMPSQPCPFRGHANSSRPCAISLYFEGYFPNIRVSFVGLSRALKVVWNQLFGTHKVSLAFSSIIAFTILRNYDCLTEAIRIAFANCATLSNAFSIPSGCRIPFTFRLPPCALRVRFALQMAMIGSIFDFRLKLSNSLRFR
jgi:hypothetical protein